MQPSVFQQYNVPAPRDDEYVNHDTAIYSLWMHFKDFCQASQMSDSTDSTDGAASVQQSRETKSQIALTCENPEFNIHTNRPRSPVFRMLTNGLSLTDSVIYDQQRPSISTCAPDLPISVVAKYDSKVFCNQEIYADTNEPRSTPASDDEMDSLINFSLEESSMLQLLPSCLFSEVEMPIDHMVLPFCRTPQVCSADRMRTDILLD